MDEFNRDGKHVEQDQSKAQKLFQSSCNLGSARACVEAGKMALSGVNGEANYQVAVQNFKFACDQGMEAGCKAAEPITFQARYEEIVSDAFKSKMCQVWTLNEEDPSLNKLVVSAKKDVFSVNAGRNSGKEFTARHKSTNYEEGKGVQIAQSFWDMSGRKQLAIEHHNWYRRMSVQSTGNGYFRGSQR